MYLILVKARDISFNFIIQRRTMHPFCILDQKFEFIEIFLNTNWKKFQIVWGICYLNYDNVLIKQYVRKHEFLNVDNRLRKNVVLLIHFIKITLTTTLTFFRELRINELHYTDFPIINV